LSRLTQKQKNLQVAVVETHPVQYRAALWRRLAEVRQIQTTVYYGSDFSLRGYHDREFGSSLAWDRPLLEGYESRVLDRKGATQGVDFWNPRPGPVYQALRRSGARVVVLNAYRSGFHLAAWLATKQLGAGMVMRLEASDEAHGRGPLFLGLKKAGLRLLYGSRTQFATIGAVARRHFLSLGISPRKLHSSPYCVDTDQVDQEKKIWRPRRSAIRKRLGVRPGETVLLFSGKLTSKKNPLMILSAIEAMEKRVREKFHLVTMGSGELEGEMNRRGRRLLGARFHPLGFLNQREMGEGYAAADALVLPSRRGQGETWGLVVNEAMQWGMPALVSDGVGCREDLVRTGETGWIFPDNSSEKLANCLESLQRLAPSKRKTMSNACERMAKHHDLAAAVRGLTHAIHSAASPSEI